MVSFYYIRDWYYFYVFITFMGDTGVKLSFGLIVTSY